MAARCPQSRLIGVGRLSNYSWTINDRGYANVVDCRRLSDLGTPATDANVIEQRPVNTIIHDTNAELLASPQLADGKVVYGLLYSLTEEDEKRLDLAEGVPSCYGKEYLSVHFWPLDPSAPLVSRTSTVANIEDIADPFAPNVKKNPNTHPEIENKNHKQVPGAPNSPRPTAQNLPTDFSNWPPGRAHVQDGSGQRVNALVYVDRKRIAPGSIRAEYIRRIQRGVAESEERGLPMQWMNRVIVPWLKEASS